jgi:hypothetical protein
MVRVISAHHFSAQDVAPCPAAPICSRVAESWLLLATRLHQVQGWKNPFFFITINAPLILKMRDIIFFAGKLHNGPFQGIF